MANPIEHFLSPALVLSKKPLSCMLRIKHGRLFISIRFYSLPQTLSYYEEFTKLEADQFVSSLAQACGYKTSRVSYKKDPLALVWDHTDGSRKLIVSGHVYSVRGKKRKPTGVMFRLKISKKQGLDLLKTIAEPLGWDLTEGE